LRSAGAILAIYCWSITGIRRCNAIAVAIAGACGAGALMVRGSSITVIANSLAGRRRDAMSLR
jgi:hypothetical protein